MNKEYKNKFYKNISFFISATIVFGFILFLMIMIHSKWYGFYILLFTVSTLYYFINLNSWKIWQSGVLWLIAIIIAISNLYISKPHKNISLLGSIASEGVRTINKLGVSPGIFLNNFSSKSSIDILNKEKPLWKIPNGYKVESHKLSSSHIELLKNNVKQDKLIYQLHGGAYLVKLNNMHRKNSIVLSKKANGADVASLDYRLAPEYTFPSALEDAIDGWNYLLNLGYKPDNIIIVGDSAGGNLALSLSLKLRDDGSKMPAGIICVSPWADLAEEGDSYKYNLYLDPTFGIDEGMKKSKPILPTEYAGNIDLHNPYISPVYGNYKRFPPMLVIVGSYEIFESDSITIYEKAIKENVNVKLIDQDGMFHDYIFMYDLLPESNAVWNQITSFINQTLY
ncbi:alpha/beta hydrolase [Romboutsia ilealis]|uniref:Alpha/beta hydrolase n=1 Tax=Romboutsia faecis TaxID=2764597 RepID=A0ABR7JKF5_9FIRM|nr:alpha/beta hydrolase [Romboutsia faecis]MBC5995399.1 alpha/beta hydrolase [Romboutsia faecis]MRN24359.1 alpha/beta hydrolase [Romboutsia ilealis]